MPAHPRVLVAQIFQETHGFTPLTTPLSAFEIETGQAMLIANEHADSVLGGMLRVFRRQGWTILPSIAARARPGGRVEDAAYAVIKTTILQAARRGGYDAIALCLHGCMQTQSLDDAEADLLGALRVIVGHDLPVVAGFDLHAHASAEMLRHLTFASAYKTNPHSDASATGTRVALELVRVLAGGQQAVAVYAHVPMLTRGNDATDQEPLTQLHESISDALQKDSALLDISLFNVNPFIDGYGVGQSIVAYAYPSIRQKTRKLVRALAQVLWDQRDRYVHTLPGVDFLLQTHSVGQGRLIIGDFGDRVLAGAPGDSVYVLDRVCALTTRRIVAVLTDPDAYAHCAHAGIGASVALMAGARYSPECSPRRITGVVMSIGDGVFRNRGVFMRGTRSRLGKYAVLQNPQYTLLITCDAVMSQDPGCYLDAGINLDAADIIVTKSGYHFKLAFAQMGACLCAETPGLTGYHPERLPFSRARPIYPLDDMAFTPTSIDIR